MAYPSLTDRVILITGGSRGLGREMALALNEAGARVVITGSTPSSALDNTLAALRGDALALVATQPSFFA